MNGLPADVIARIEQLHRAESEAHAHLARTVATHLDADESVRAAQLLVQARQDFYAYVRSLAD